MTWQDNVVSDDEVPDIIGDDEALLRRCGRRDVRADGSVKKNAFIRTVFPLEISVTRENYVPDPWFDIAELPSKSYRLRLSTRKVRATPNADVRVAKPPPFHAVIACLLDGRESTDVSSRDDLTASEWSTLVRLCEELAKLSTSLGPPLDG